jgi:glycosyltransferase involved in cell wall biosynthesis
MYGSDLEELYTSALAYVLPSELEGLSISLLEAMAFGLPVVVSDIPGNTEALGDPPAGIVYPLRDRRALAAALKRVAESAELRRDLGQKAVARVREAYDWETIADQTLAVYQRALGRPPSG